MSKSSKSDQFVAFVFLAAICCHCVILQLEADPHFKTIVDGAFTDTLLFGKKKYHYLCCQTEQTDKTMHTSVV